MRSRKFCRKLVKGTPVGMPSSPVIVFYAAFLADAFTFAHLARCAAAIFLRAAADIDRLIRLPFVDWPVPLFTSLLKTSIALLRLERSSFNCSNTSPRFVIDLLSLGKIRLRVNESYSKLPVPESVCPTGRRPEI